MPEPSSSTPAHTPKRDSLSVDDAGIVSMRGWPLRHFLERLENIARLSPGEAPSVIDFGKFLAGYLRASKVDSTTGEYLAILALDAMRDYPGLLPTATNDPDWTGPACRRDRFSLAGRVAQIACEDSAFEELLDPVWDTLERIRHVREADPRPLLDIAFKNARQDFIDQLDTFAAIKPVLSIQRKAAVAAFITTLDSVGTDFLDAPRQEVDRKAIACCAELESALKTLTVALIEGRLDLQPACDELKTSLRYLKMEVARALLTRHKSYLDTVLPSNWRFDAPAFEAGMNKILVALDRKDDGTYAYARLVATAKIVETEARARARPDLVERLQALSRVLKFAEPFLFRKIAEE